MSPTRRRGLDGWKPFGLSELLKPARDNFGCFPHDANGAMRQRSELMSEFVRNRTRQQQGRRNTVVFGSLHHAVVTERTNGRMVCYWWRMSWQTSCPPRTFDFPSSATG
jgi:hypothetical protein